MLGSSPCFRVIFRALASAFNLVSYTKCIPGLHLNTFHPGTLQYINDNEEFGTAGYPLGPPPRVPSKSPLAFHHLLFCVVAL